MKPSKQITAIIIWLIGLQNINAQDRLVFGDGTELNVRIKKETPFEINFTKWQDADSPVFITGKSELRKIYYMNGDVAVFEFTADSLNTELLAKSNFTNSNYSCWITSNPKRRFIIGTLFTTLDSAILLKPKSKNKNDLLSIPIAEIKNMHIVKKGKAGKNALIAGGIGALTGALFGFASGNDNCDGQGWGCVSFSSGQKALGGGLVLGGAGILIGAISGAASKITFRINGSQKDYKNKRAELRKYSVTRK